MTPGSIARRYARALYELAVEEGTVIESGQALAELAAAIEASGESEAFASGILTGELRRRIGRTLAERLGTATTLGKFVMVVAAHDRIAYLPAIWSWYRRLDDEAAGRVRLEITAAHALEERELDEIRAAFARITGREPIARTETDAELIAGAIVEVEGRVYDGSVRTALARLAERMAGGIE